jgi:hypothetical protein
MSDNGSVDATRDTTTMGEATGRKADLVAKRPRCGLVMPISAMGDYTESHWLDVRSILSESLEGVGYEVALVSDADEISVIQKRIVQNLHDNPLVVCDVSGGNPNVMFELGIRLAFDKPTIIVMDNVTKFSFDTQVIEHLRYPRDLRYGRINEFKVLLGKKAAATSELAAANDEYSPFLRHFGEFKAAKVESTELPQGQFVMKQLEEIQATLVQLQNRGTQKNWNKHSKDHLITSQQRPDNFSELLESSLSDVLEKNDIKYDDRMSPSAYKFVRSQVMNLMAKRGVRIDYPELLDSLDDGIKRIFERKSSPAIVPPQ